MAAAAAAAAPSASASASASASGTAVAAAAAAAASPFLTELSSLRSFFRESLRNFAMDPRQQVSIVYSQASSTTGVGGQAAAAAAAATAAAAGSTQGTIKSVFVLDSSFNPPSKAHEWIAKSAVVEHLQEKREREGEQEREETRLLLLLATRNADKPGPPEQAGGFEDRMVMMVCLARNLLAEVADIDPGGLVVDIGLTKMPYFVGKAEAIDQSGVYGKAVEQVHLVGFDTLTRIFERKYYAELGLEVLTPFLKRHRLRVLTRPGDDEHDKKGWGSGKEQREWLEKMRRGELEELGCRKEWAERIELVDVEGAEGAEVLGVSSTKAREAVKTGRWGDVDKLLGATVVAWVREAGLYQEEGAGGAKSRVGS